MWRFVCCAQRRIMHGMTGSCDPQVQPLWHMSRAPVVPKAGGGSNQLPPRAFAYNPATLLHVHNHQQHSRSALVANTFAGCNENPCSSEAIPIAVTCWTGTASGWRLAAYTLF